jgi:hexapeptide transferase family protein
MEDWELDKKRKGQLPIYQFWYRVYKTIPTYNKPLKWIIKKIYILSEFFYGCEIHPDSEIGAGLYLGHPWHITINGKAKIGKNCNIHKNATIGQESRGERIGAPTIGNSVWIGINSTIVGNIRIGDDVMIAPNSFVNCDVPAHSIVFGNPCIIRHKQNATDGYVNNIV